MQIFFAALLAALLLGACSPSQRYERSDVSASSAPTSLELAAPATQARQLPAGTAGMPMMYEIRPQAQANLVLARLLEESLRRDPSGNAPIEGGPCTTPRMFAEAISAYHPGSLSAAAIRQLPDYIRSLIRRPAPDGLHTMSRVLVGSGACTLDLEGWARTFAPDEGAWYDPNTGKPVLAGDCSNVVAAPSRRATTSVPPPPPVAPQPTEVACVPLPPRLARMGEQLVIFPSVEDRAAWVACNPWAECSTDCPAWLAGWGDGYAPRIRALTGMGTRGSFFALEGRGITSMPAHTVGVSVACRKTPRGQRDQHEYYQILPGQQPRVIAGL